MAWERLYITISPPELIVPARPDDYDEDLIWVPGEWDGDDYTPPAWDDIPGNYAAAGGGRYNQNLVAVGHNLVYYEEFS